MQLSDKLETAQVAIEEEDARRSIARAQGAQRTLREQGALARTKGGRQLFRHYAGKLTTELERIIAIYSAKKAPGVHHAAIPLLHAFDRLERVSIVALRSAINQLAQPTRFTPMCKLLGGQLELEIRALRLAEKRRAAMRRLQARSSSIHQLLREEELESLGLYVAAWDVPTKVSLGAFVADALCRIDMIRVETVVALGQRPTKWVLPTPRALQVAQVEGEELCEVRRSAMICPPRPWTGHWGGGHLDNPHPLIRAGRSEGRQRGIQAQPVPSLLLEAVNHLQGVALMVDSELVGELRDSWLHGIAGLWPQQRVAPEVPPQPEQTATQAEWRSWRRQAALAHQNRRLYRAVRLDCERRVGEMERMLRTGAGPWWQAHQVDFRGRIYPVNRTVTHQAPDQCKAVLSFADARPLDDEGFRWLLKAAAGHFGLGRQSWQERLQWGEEQLQRHLAVADAPLDRLELWRDASDPWQYLQLARAIRSWCEDRSTPIGVPIRFDQTTSGCGILAALLRDEEIGRITNLVGDTRGDLYDVVAQLLKAKARADLESEYPAVRMCAEMALEWGIDRKLCKPAVLSRPYGGTLWGLTASLVEARDEALGGVGNRSFHVRVGMPAEYLASRMWRILCKTTARLMRFQLWARRASRIVLASGGEMAVTTPSGLKLQLGERAKTGRMYHSWLAGRACVSTTLEERKKWSPELTAKTISPNWVHSFDAAFCTLVAARCAAEGIPLLTNHDCFAAPPWAASQLRQVLKTQVRGLYATDWLAVQREELMLSAGVELPELPERGQLDPSLIGQNPYLFS